MTDTIRILVATDNHVGVNERDPVRSDDSWKTFHEIMCLANEREVDMVLLAGDLFHENKPSRKSMYYVMRSLRMNCFGARPCELEMLSDGSEHFDAAFDHVNYEDPDINVSIPVFSIHGNHDDPSGQGHYAALDILAMSGLVNYFGKVPESDNIEVRPLLLQKGSTKLALYGLSNVRDERLHRTFRDGRVKFFQAGTQQKEWFHMICVHQNHYAHTETNYLPENFLPQFLDLVIWGHEHECLIDPTHNPEMNFDVMQPGSSVATSLMPGEAVPKHVAILNITGRQFKVEKICLKTVRPFVFRDIVLSSDKKAVTIGKKDDHRTELTRHLIRMVEDMIEEARQQWEAAQPEVDADEDDENENENQEDRVPLPLIRLRVEHTSADGLSKFQVENPQRFSQRFADKVANPNDVVQFHTRKRNTSARTVRDVEAEKEAMARVASLDTIKVDKLVREFLEAQSLIILPQNYFGDAVTQFVDKDDKHAMEMFVNDSLANQIKQLVRMQGEDDDEDDDDNLATQIEDIRSKLEADFAKGKLRVTRNKNRYKPKPDDWDTEEEGEWEDEPAALIRSEDEVEDGEDEEGADSTPVPRAGIRGRGRGRGVRGAISTRGRGTTARKTSTAGGRGSKRAASVVSDDEQEADDVMLDDEVDEDSQAMFIPENKKKRTNETSASTSSRGKTETRRGTRAASPVKKPPARAAAAKGKQSTLSFTNSQRSVLGSNASTGTRTKRQSNDDVEDSEDGFEEVSQPVSRRTRR